MSANDSSFGEKVLEAKALLENHDDGEYEALSTNAKVNYQEALEFLSRLESSLETAEREECDPDRTDEASTRADGGEDREIEIDTDLESTMGDDGDRVGPFGGDDVVVYDPNHDDEGWLSMRYDATVPIENMR